MEVARIHAENAIRQKNQSQTFLQMSYRVETVANRVQFVVMNQKFTSYMSSVVKSIDSSLKKMNLEQVVKLLDKFEKQLETADVQVDYMGSTIGNTSTISMPQNDVDTLMMNAADEAGLDLCMTLSNERTITSLVSASTAANEQDELTRRLANLRTH